MSKLDLRDKGCCKEIKKSLLCSEPGLLSGLKELDSVIGGFACGELVLVAGRPGMGKSSLARDLALNIGKKDTVLFYSLEMSKAEVAELLLTNLARVDWSKVVKGKPTDEVLSRIDQACTRLSNYNIVIDGECRVTPEYIRKDLEEYSNKNDAIGCVVVDYIQLMSIGRRESRRVEVSEISRELKVLAKDFGIPVIALSQLNRNLESRESTRPRLSDLSESGSLEQDADTALLLHRPSYYDKMYNPNAVDTGETEIIIAKQRKGDTCIIRCGFIAECSSFMNIPVLDRKVF